MHRQRRNTDFYPEGSLLWLDVDTKLRELSHDKKSLDDFAHAFHGIRDGEVAVVGYDFNEIVTALDKVASFDWATFLHTLLNASVVNAPLEGITRGGWKLVYIDQVNDVLKAREKRRKVVDLTDPSV